MQVQAGEEVADPANRVQLVAFVQAHSETFAKLQSDFQCVSSRIGQARDTLCCVGIKPCLQAQEGQSQTWQIIHLHVCGVCRSWSRASSL